MFLDEVFKKRNNKDADSIITNMKYYHLAERYFAISELLPINNKYDDRPKLECYIHAIPHAAACNALAKILKQEFCIGEETFDLETITKAALAEVRELEDRAGGDADNNASRFQGALEMLSQEEADSDGEKDYGDFDRHYFVRRIERFRNTFDMAAIKELTAIEDPYDEETEIEHYLRALAHTGAATAITNVATVEGNYVLMNSITPSLEDMINGALRAVGLLDDGDEDDEDFYDEDEDEGDMCASEDVTPKDQRERKGKDSAEESD